jgi:uncharacterized protein (TIGR03067 family)
MFAGIACLFAVFPLLEPAAAPPELRGAWKLVSVEADEGKFPDSHPVLVIKGDQLLYGGEAVARITADPGTKPKVMDLHFKGPERVYEGIYVVEKDALKICLSTRSDGVKERPDGFAVKGQPAWRLLAFERVKAADPKAGTGFVGLQLRYDDNKKVAVADTLAGSPARKAGFKKEDVLLQVGDTAVTDLRSAIGAVQATPPGGDLKMRVRRDGQERDVTVRVGLLPFRFLAGLE